MRLSVTATIQRTYALVRRKANTIVMVAMRVIREVTFAAPFPSFRPCRVSRVTMLAELVNRA
jgi:hypothetical protein